MSTCTAGEQLLTSYIMLARQTLTRVVIKTGSTMPPTVVMAVAVRFPGCNTSYVPDPRGGNAWDGWMTLNFETAIQPKIDYVDDGPGQPLPDIPDDIMSQPDSNASASDEGFEEVKSKKKPKSITPRKPEPEPTPPPFPSHLYKRGLCAFFGTQGKCLNGENCTFAHGRHELQAPPSRRPMQGSWRSQN